MSYSPWGRKELGLTEQLEHAHMHASLLHFTTILVIRMHQVEFPIQLSILYNNTVKANVKSLSHVQLFVTPWTVVYQAPPSMGFSRQEYWSGLPFPSPGDLPDP